MIDRTMEYIKSGKGLSPPPNLEDKVDKCVDLIGDVLFDELCLEGYKTQIVLGKIESIIRTTLR